MFLSMSLTECWNWGDSDVMRSIRIWLSESLNSSLNSSTDVITSHLNYCLVQILNQTSESRFNSDLTVYSGGMFWYKVLMTIIEHFWLHLSVCGSLIYWQTMSLRYRKKKTALHSTKKKQKDNLYMQCCRNYSAVYLHLLMFLSVGPTNIFSCDAAWKECLIQPPQASAVTAARRVICVCGCLSYTFHIHAETNSLMGLRNG